MTLFEVHWLYIYIYLSIYLSLCSYDGFLTFLNAVCIW
jgi:hypothetical protein